MSDLSGKNPMIELGYDRDTSSKHTVNESVDQESHNIGIYLRHFCSKMASCGQYLTILFVSPHPPQ